MVARRLQARQQVAITPVTGPQPTTTIGLSTTFTPPASCVATNRITILPSPGYLIWLDEPVPYPSVTVSDCYPSEFLQSYTSIAPTSSRALGSSIVPVMSPLVCPLNYCTAYIADHNYIACCPSGYDFETTGIPVVTDRPAYGGICFTNIAMSKTMTAVVYDAIGSSNQQLWFPSTTGAQGWAHPIDGFAASSPTLGCPAERSTSVDANSLSSIQSVASSSSSATSGSPDTSSTTNSNGISGGTIAGAVVGSICGLVAIIALIWFLLRRRKAQSSDSTQQMHHSQDSDSVQQIHQVDNTQIYQVEDDFARVEKDAGPIPATEIGSSGQQASGMNSSRGAYEMAADRGVEMPTPIDSQVDEKRVA